MNIREIQTIYDYNYWANRRIVAAAAQIRPEQFLANTSHSYGSLRGTLVHILDSEHGWRMLCQNKPDAHFDTYVPEMFPTVEALAQKWNEDEQAMRDYLARLSDDDMTSIVRYQGDGRAKRERPLWHCLYHLANHGTQHRSEAAVMLTDFGSSPGDLDFTLFVNETIQKSGR